MSNSSAISGATLNSGMSLLGLHPVTSEARYSGRCQEGYEHINYNLRPI